MNEHGGVVNRLFWMQDAYRLDSRDAVLQKTPFSFDVSVWEFFWPFFTGARLVMARPEGHKDPAYLTEIIRRGDITTLHFVPSMLQLFLGDLNAGSCSNLRRVVCSGEALPLSLAKNFHECLPRTDLYNLYGPTEAAVDVTAWPSQPGYKGSSAPIGCPIANTRMYVLDQHLQPVPVGVAGELYIGGVQVARGYLNRPELTAERFVPDPFKAPTADEPKPRIYKTGDLGRWLPDGNIEFLGRNDFQVKIRGFRIELGEIEARLAAIAGVKEAVVLAREDAPGEKRLVAYYNGSEELTAGIFRSHLVNDLPEYMVPAAYVRLETLPLTPNGKLDRKALPAPEGGAFGVRVYEAPIGEIETTLAQVWSELLKVERVGRHDHFFELGGHSLMAVTLISRMSEKGLYADVRTLFTSPILCEFAEAFMGKKVIVSNILVPDNLLLGSSEFNEDEVQYDI
jgi:acyl-coenzyme A synthetase/AMP-(fatty) acid ligase